MPQIEIPNRSACTLAGPSCLVHSEFWDRTSLPETSHYHKGVKVEVPRVTDTPGQS